MTAGTAVCGPACTVVWEPGLAYWVSPRPPDYVLSFAIIKFCVYHSLVPTFNLWRNP